MLRTLTMTELRQKAKTYHITGRYQNLGRSTITRLIAAIKIQRMWRRHRPRNLCDPFTLEPFSSPVRFFHVEDYNTIWQFEPSSLYDYFLISGHFCNPFTRKPFLVPELRRLDKILQKTGRKDLVPLANNANWIKQHHRQVQENALTVDLLYQEAIGTMEGLWQPQIVTFQNFIHVIDYAYEVCQRILPTFLTQINDLRQRDALAARQCLESVLYHLAEVGRETPSFLGVSFYSMAQRNAAASAYIMLMDYYNNTFRRR